MNTASPALENTFELESPESHLSRALITIYGRQNVEASIYSVWGDAVSDNPIVFLERKLQDIRPKTDISYIHGGGSIISETTNTTGARDYKSATLGFTLVHKLVQDLLSERFTTDTDRSVTDALHELIGQLEIIRPEIAYEGGSEELDEAIVEETFIPKITRQLDDGRVKVIMLTMGTDQMVDVAQYIKQYFSKRPHKNNNKRKKHASDPTFRSLNKPIIITGANFGWNETESDGPMNVALAAIWARLPSLPNDVFIAFGGRIIPARNAVEAPSDSFEPGLKLIDTRNAQETAYANAYRNLAATQTNNIIEAATRLKLPKTSQTLLTEFTIRERLRLSRPNTIPAQEQAIADPDRICTQVIHFDLHPLSTTNDALKPLLETENAPVPSIIIIETHHCSSLRRGFLEDIGKLTSLGHVVVVIPHTGERRTMLDYKSTEAILYKGGIPGLGVDVESLKVKSLYALDYLRHIKSKRENDHLPPLTLKEQQRIMIDVLYYDFAGEMHLSENLTGALSPDKRIKIDKILEGYISSLCGPPFLHPLLTANRAHVLRTRPALDGLFERQQNKH